MKKEKTSKAVIVAEIQHESLKEPMALGSVFALSGMFPDVKTQAQAVVKILAGKELGIAPLEAMTNIYIVGSRLGITAKLMASQIKRSVKYDYAIDKLDDTECQITFYQNAIRDEGVTTKKLGTSTFSIKDAAKAGLINKDNWKNYPRNMLYCRALSNGARWFTPDVVSGYIIEELMDMPEKTNIIEMNMKGKVKVNGEEKL